MDGACIIMSQHDRSNRAPFLLSAFLLLFLFDSMNARSASDDGKSETKPQNNLPMIAIWRQSDGFTRQTRRRPIHIAVWDDGKAVWGQFDSTGKYSQRTTVLSAEKLKLLTKALGNARIFSLRLNENHNTLIDAPFDSIFYRHEDRCITLNWDRAKRDGDNETSNARANRQEFESIWELTESVAKLAIPEVGAEDSHDYEQEMDSWYFSQHGKKRICATEPEKQSTP